MHAQIVLYANTDGRGFFNKAAADDSDRTLIEYLRGMVNIVHCLNHSKIALAKMFSANIPAAQVSLSSVFQYGNTLLTIHLYAFADSGVLSGLRREEKWG